MTAYRVAQHRVHFAPLDDTDISMHRELSRGDYLGELPDDNPRVADWYRAGLIMTEEQWQAAQVNPATLGPSFDVVAGRGGPGDRPVLPDEDLPGVGDQQPGAAGVEETQAAGARHTAKASGS